MQKEIKKAFLLGLGAASLTGQQAKKVIDKLVSDNAVTMDEGRALLTSVRQKAEIEGKRLQKQIQAEAKRLHKGLHASTKNRMNEARSHLRQLDKELTKQGKVVLRRALKKLE